MQNYTNDPNPDVSAAAQALLDNMTGNMILSAAKQQLAWGRTLDLSTIDSLGKLNLPQAVEPLGQTLATAPYTARQAALDALAQHSQSTATFYARMLKPNLTPEQIANLDPILNSSNRITPTSIKSLSA